MAKESKSGPDGHEENSARLRNLLQDPRLPRGVRKHIRKLKEQGYRENADSYQRQELITKFRKKGRAKEASLLLLDTVKNLSEIDSPAVFGVELIKYAWLLEAVQEIDAEKRINIVNEIYLNIPEEFHDEIESGWEVARSSVSRYMP